MTIAYVIKEHFQQTIKQGTGVVLASALKKLTVLSEKIARDGANGAVPGVFLGGGIVALS
ncbi:MAG TPA: hypothetical protein VJP02_29120 [Candidatus Sulfotelmatobacter sp.]|nr:hypothetical protein [Candidatus Sulfotelmatobacter sp.]